MANAQSEPSMDEILASIRRIISEEDDTQARRSQRLETLTLGEEAAVQDEDASDEAPEDPDEVEAAAPFPVEDSLDDFSEGEEAEAADDTASALIDEESDMSAASASAKTASVIHESVAKAAVSDIRSRLVAEETAGQVAEAFGTLEQNVRMSSSSARTMEDIVEAMLAPMIRDWLDDHLPRIVEEKVEEEVRRIARRRG